MNKKDLKITNNLKAHIKDLEYQIDCLIGYSPSGLHWKQEYTMRKNMLEGFVSDPDVPQEALDKVFRLQDKLYEIRNNEAWKQDYIDLDMEDYKIPRNIPVRHFGEIEGYIEL